MSRFIRRPKREHERLIFESFLKVKPDFAGEPLTDWHQPSDETDFPDIKGITTCGRTVGVELGEWLNEDQMRAGRDKEDRETSVLNAIGEQPPNTTKHIRFVWLHPKRRARIRPADAAGFREQLLAFIHECNARWPRERYWQAGARLGPEDFLSVPMLHRYLDGIRLFPLRDGQKWGEGIDWITFRLWGGFFNQDTMLVPLKELIERKTSRYGSRTGIDDLSLIVFYNLAALYNSPVDTPLHPFHEVVKAARDVVKGGKGPFDRVFLFIALEPGEVFRLDE